MISWALLWVLAGPDLAHANAEAFKVLARPEVGFCHDRKYPLTDREAAWCPPVAPNQNSRCPAFAAACQAPRAVLKKSTRLDFSRNTQDGGDDSETTEETPSPTDTKSAPEPSSPRKTPERKVIEDPEPPGLPPLGGLGYVLFWLIVGAGVIFLVVLILRNRTSHRDDAPEQAVDPVAADGPQFTAQADQAQLIRDVDVLLERAQAAARAGDYARAIHQAHAALLFRLDHDGLIRVAPSRTNGDYIRDLQPAEALRQEVRSIVRDVEAVQFGTTGADANLYDRILKRIVPIATRSGAMLLVVCALNLLSCDLKRYPFDHSPSGAGPIIELAAAYDLEIKFRTTPLADIDPDDGTGNGRRTLVLLHDAPEPSPETWLRLFAWAEAGHQLVLAGRDVPTPLGVVATHGDVGINLFVADDYGDRMGSLNVVTPDRKFLRPIDDAHSGRTLLEFLGGEAYAIHFPQTRQGGVTVFADDRLFTAGALMLHDNPEFLVRFLRELDSREIEFADGLLEAGAKNPAEALANARLTPLILQLLGLLAIFYLCRGVRFGRPHDPPQRSRRQFSEHAEALGGQYARARASHHASGLYAAWAIDRLREKTLTSRTPGLYPLAQAIASRTGDDEGRVMQLLVEAKALRDDTPTAAPAATGGDFQVMQELARLVALVGGPR